MFRHLLHVVLPLALLAAVARAQDDASFIQPDPTDLPVGWMPTGDTFEPLIADPYWPVFNIGYQRYLDDPYLENVVHVAFGDTFPLYRSANVKALDYFEVGLQGAVHTVFDQDMPSNDQLNADFFGGPYLAGRRGLWSGHLRALHRSSHIGDEFLLNEGAENGITRENFGFERIDLYLSRDFTSERGKFARIYGGFGRTLGEPNPAEWEEWRLQYGVEVMPTIRLFDIFRPVAAADVQHQQGNDFKFDLSVRAGVQVEHPDINGRAVRLLFEYYNGRNVNGQFWEDDLQYAGFGVFINL